MTHVIVSTLIITAFTTEQRRMSKQRSISHTGVKELINLYLDMYLSNVAIDLQEKTGGEMFCIHIQYIIYNSLKSNKVVSEGRQKFLHYPCSEWANVFTSCQYQTLPK